MTFLFPFEKYTIICIHHQLFLHIRHPSYSLDNTMCIEDTYLHLYEVSHAPLHIK